MSEKLSIDCPQCLSSKLIKLIGIGGAVIIRGTKTPCNGGIKSQKQKKKNKPKPFWRNGPVNTKILKNPTKYVETGEI